MMLLALALASVATAFQLPSGPGREATRLGAGFGKAATGKVAKAKQIEAGPKPMDKQWDNYFALTEQDAITKEVWITTPGAERPLPLGFVACKEDGDVAEALALQRSLVFWCAEGLHPRLAPFLRGKRVKGEVELELAFCDVAAVSEEEKQKELDANDPTPEGKPPGGPLTMLGSVKAPPSLSPKDVGFMPFKSPIQANQASVKQSSAPKREMSSGRSKKR